MVPVLPGSTMRNLCIDKGIFYIIGNAGMGWESHIMSTDKLCFLSEESGGTGETCSAISLQNNFSVLHPSVGKPRSSVAQEVSPVLRDESKPLPKAPCQLQPGCVSQKTKRKTFVL